MAEGIPTPGEIESAARKVQETAVRVRGELELRYIPERPDHHARGIAGRSASDYPMHPYGVDENGNYLGTAEQWAALRAQYDWVPGVFVDRIGPEPTGFDPLIDAMRSTALALYNGESHEEPVGNPIRQAQSHLGNWSGYAAETFNANFINRIPEVSKHQAFLAGTLQHAMIANKDIFANARRDLKGTAEAAITALEATTKCRGGKAPVYLSVAAAVATMLAGVASAPLTGGATLAPAGVAAFTIIAGATSGLSVAASFDQPVRQDLGADTVDLVLSKTVDAVIAISTEVDKQEKKIVAALHTNLDLLTDTSGGGVGKRSPRDEFLAPRPALIEESRSRTVIGDFTPP
jgi:hypothetical protein